MCYINPDNHSFKSLLTLQLFLEKKFAHTLFSCAHANSLLYRCYDTPAHERVYIRLFQRENSYSKKEEGFLYSYKIIVKKA